MWTPCRRRDSPLSRSVGIEGVVADLAELVAGFVDELRAEGLPVGTDRCARFARAVTVLDPGTRGELYMCAQATLVSEPDHLEVLDRVFRRVFAGDEDPSGTPGQEGPPAVARSALSTRHGGGASPAESASGPSRDTVGETEAPSIASATERLGHKDFGELSAPELMLLAEVMRRFAFAPPPRRSRRRQRAPHGRSVDLRSTLRNARRTGGDPTRLSRFRFRSRPRKLVVLCDISGSMEPYSRAMLQLLYCAAGGVRAEVFTFATRLTRMTRVLAHARPSTLFDRAGPAAPDWSGGTRIADALREFLVRHGRRGMARGAVVVIVSDGWETGDPDQLSRRMAELSRLAYRIVWVNPRLAARGYRPLAGGMAAAWPHCDAVVSGHRLDALEEVMVAIADPVRRRSIAITAGLFSRSGEASRG